jgi:hypothetical protein
MDLSVVWMSFRKMIPHGETYSKQKSPVRVALGLAEGASSREKRNLRGMRG